MNPTEIINAFNDGLLESFIKSAQTSGSYVEINGKVALPLTSVIPSYSKGIDLEVLDEVAQLLGVLCFCRDLGEVIVSSLSEDKYIAYLCDVSQAEFGDTYIFRKDYLVIPFSRLIEYQTEYMEGSPIWGGLLHEHPLIAPLKCYQDTKTSIIAHSGIKMPTTFHQESAARSTLEPFAFERFLKLYHLLELLFDYSLVQKLKSLPNDLQGAGELLSHYSARDTFRLKSVILDGHKDIPPLVSCLNEIEHHIPIATTVFFDFGKDGNPFKEASDLTELVAQGGFSEAAYKKAKLRNSNQHPSFILDCSVYFIYRIRCCIAHHKIGEYVLKTADEEFVVRFGEPLLREVLRQCFSKKSPSIPGNTTATLALQSPSPIPAASTSTPP